jgi:Tfp pilus assembly protein PilV
MRAEADSGRPARRGFAIGELLVAVLLLAIAVSSVAALMYSVSHRSPAREQTACVAAAGAANGTCATTSAAGGPRLLRSGCIAKSANTTKECPDSLLERSGSGEIILRSRTDSASLGMVAKKQKQVRETVRTDRGFIR